MRSALNKWTVLLAAAALSQALEPQLKDGGECSGNGVVREPGVCSCFPGHTGPQCSLSCVNGTVDSQGVCQCQPHFSGDLCDVACSGNGDVVGGVCQCRPVYSGPECSIVCGGHGALSVGGKCLCDATWAGVNCTAQCNGHGSVTAQGTCACDFPFSGPSCTSVCNARNTTAVDTALGMCACVGGFSGKVCDVECSGNGGVVDGRCVCKSEIYSGPLCEHVCSGAGEVQNGRCVCHDTQNTDATCRESHGVCNGGTCVCDAGYVGDHCSIPCSGHGSLAEAQDGSVKCFCDALYGGAYCELECSGVGRVVDGACACPSLLGGSACHSVCNDNGVLIATLQSHARYVVPRLTMAELAAVTGVTPETSASDLATSFLTAQSRLALPDGWLVNHAECVCLHPQVSGVACQSPCQSHGTLPHQAEVTLRHRVAQCESATASVEECTDPLSWFSDASLPSKLEQMPRPVLDEDVACVCDALYGSDSQRGCFLCGGVDAGALSQNGSTCECINGHRGSACQEPCNGFGWPVDGVCHCQHGITGRFCEESCEFLCKAGTCNGQECVCDEGYSGEWCDLYCYLRQGEEVCDRVFDTYDKPAKRASASVFLTVLTWLLAIALVVTVALIVRQVVFVDIPLRKQRNLVSNRSRYMTQRGPAVDDEHVPGQISLEEAPQYDDYYDNPHFAANADHRLDERRASVGSDDEIEVDLNQLRSS